MDSFKNTNPADPAQPVATSATPAVNDPIVSDTPVSVPAVPASQPEPVVPDYMKEPVVPETSAAPAEPSVSTEQPGEKPVTPTV